MQNEEEWARVERQKKDKEDRCTYGRAENHQLAQNPNFHDNKSCRCMPIMQALGRGGEEGVKQENHEFEDTLGWRVGLRMLQKT